MEGVQARLGNESEQFQQLTAMMNDLDIRDTPEGGVESEEVPEALALKMLKSNEPLTKFDNSRVKEEKGKKSWRASISRFAKKVVE